MSYPRKISLIVLVLGHILVPAVFFFVGYLAIFEGLNLTWQLIVVLFIACLPFVLCLVAKYVKRLKIGESEYEAPEAAALSDNEVKKLTLTAPQKKEALELKYGDLGKEAIKVLRTLWSYQRQHFGAHDSRRWGFKIQAEAADYSFFRIGAVELREKGLTAETDHGLFFLTNQGMEFCRQHTSHLAGGSDIWKNFAPAH